MKHINLLRAIDANFNRAREALRVIEDILRFSNFETQRISEIRKLRHFLTRQYLKNFGHRPITERDTISDIGKKNKPYPAQTPKQIITRNFLRAEEALRCIEEFSRIINPESTTIWQDFRFNVYNIEKDVLIKIPEKILGPGFKGFLCDAKDSEKLLEKNPDFLIIKPFDSVKKTLQLLNSLKKIVKKTIILVYDRPDIALASDIDGVHLKPDSIQLDQARKILPGKIIGLETENIKSINSIYVNYVALKNYEKLKKHLTKKQKNIKVIVAAIVNSRQEEKKAKECGVKFIIFNWLDKKETEKTHGEKT